MLLVVFIIFILLYDWEKSCFPILFFNYSLHLILLCVSFRYIAQWLDKHILSKCPPDTSSTHLAPYTVTIIILTMLPTLHCTSLWLFCNYRFALIFVTKFIGVTFVNKIIQVSSVQFYDTSLLYCIVCPWPKVK